LAAAAVQVVEREPPLEPALLAVVAEPAEVTVGRQLAHRVRALAAQVVVREALEAVDL
jgi:hypothetical protein